jgi:hypothetical protein
MRVRIIFAAIVASLALAAFGAPTAGAATNTGGIPAVTDAGPLMTIPMTGVAKNGKKFTGKYGIYKFVVKDGKVWSVGTLSGKLKGRTVKRGNVMMPAQLTGDSTAANTAQAGSCTVLHLVLGPINLNLLGLRVATNEIRLLVEAVPGAGNLLGNLLCAITNLLNPSANTPLGQLVQVLNALLALSPRTTA